MHDIEWENKNWKKNTTKNVNQQKISEREKLERDKWIDKPDQTSRKRMIFQWFIITIRIFT